VDAPVSGGVNAAAAGTLTFMVGADSEAAFATAKQILESMGAKVRFRTISLAFRTFDQRDQNE
jgi:3-hydroxyisobutyrate dehydrogenase-like beta-hydroxyacid dehydrogenase